MGSLTRRAVLRLIGFGAALLGGRRSARAQPAIGSTPVTGRWSRTHDRVWLGEEYWANPMEDWRVAGGAAESLAGGGDRNVHLLTHQLADPRGSFSMSVRISRVETGVRDGGAGFRLGIRSDVGDYRSSCFAKGGIRAGVIGDTLVLGDDARLLESGGRPGAFGLRLEGEPDGEAQRLSLTAESPSGERLGRLETRVPFERLRGNVTLVSNFDAAIPKGQGSRHRFADWAVGGTAFRVEPGQVFGPVLWSMYSVSDSRSDEGFVLKLSALTAPLGREDEREVGLELQRGGEWTPLARATLDPEAWTATFRVPRWDATREARFRIVYDERHRDGSRTAWSRTGTIRADPVGRPLRLAALTCQNAYAFPYAPVAENLLGLDPDMLFFSGDQIYEDHGGYGLIREPADAAILNYLRKFYMFGWAFGDAMRDRPTLCLPDDHDVFQGNLWGEGGAAMPGGASDSSAGGYREPPAMVNVVHRTTTAHHPDPFDPTPGAQGISVYFGDMVWGGVGFAILADRQFKSGPQRVSTGAGRADHVEDPDFDTSSLDRPGLSLLGERQHAFLRRWVVDWRGHALKVVLSQTPFAGVATHHGEYDGYLKADLDCGGWPQSARDEALRILREAMPLHVNGDQHLAALVQHGIEEQRDASWSFCVPAIAAGYPRWWRPDDLGVPHRHRPAHGLPDTGEYRDGLGNLVYVYAVGNPEVASRQNRYELAHQKGSGFGLVTIDTAAKTYHLEAFRFLVDAVRDRASSQFPGWPITLHQAENRGQNRIGQGRGGPHPGEPGGAASSARHRSPERAP